MARRVPKAELSTEMSESPPGGPGPPRARWGVRDQAVPDTVLSGLQLGRGASRPHPGSDISG